MVESRLGNLELDVVIIALAVNIGDMDIKAFGGAVVVCEPVEVDSIFGNGGAGGKFDVGGQFILDYRINK